jgi:hypothetical protein
MKTDLYFDMRNLASPLGIPRHCPVSDCAALLETADSQWGKMPYCPVHRIQIHGGSHTFVYYDGPDSESKRNAALRNIPFERDYFKEHILGNAAKAESHRICNENSEDALTWNVFSRLARGGRLKSLVSALTGLSLKTEPEIYLWGLKVNLDDSSKPALFPPLKSGRDLFESDVVKFWTEPDIMLYAPGELLLLIEAKFTSGNPITLPGVTNDVAGEKPKSREGILQRYKLPEPPRGALLNPSLSGPFYSQLYRNLVFAIHMAEQLGVKWGLVNLVSEGQFHQRRKKVEFQDPTPFIQGLLPEKSRGRFTFYSWERLYAEHVDNVTELQDLAAYMYNKSANGVRALDVELATQPIA